MWITLIVSNVRYLDIFLLVLAFIMGYFNVFFWNSNGNWFEQKLKPTKKPNVRCIPVLGVSLYIYIWHLVESARGPKRS